MGKRDFNKEFKEIMIGYAARDMETMTAIEAALEAQEVMIGSMPEGEADLAANLASYYALDPDDMATVYDIQDGLAEEPRDY